MQSLETCRQWMQRSHLMVIPSVTATNGDSEGLPTVLLEAQACGLPVIASMHAGIPEVVIHGETGFLTAERDWQQIAHYISHLQDNAELWQHLSYQGQKRVRCYFDLTKQAKTLENLYQTTRKNYLEIRES
jgi:glycosyltransferase involved in cell wall biosynthesis